MNAFGIINKTILNKILQIAIGIFLLSSINCVTLVYNTKISEKEKEEGVYAKEVVTINGHAYLMTSKSYSKIRVIIYSNMEGQSIEFDTYSGSLTVEPKDLNKDGLKDLHATATRYLSNYAISEIVLANNEGELNFKQPYRFDGYFPLKGKSFAYVQQQKSYNFPDIKEIILCEWSDIGFVKKQYCYLNTKRKDCTCFPKTLINCETEEDFDKQQENGVELKIDDKLKDAINYWRFW